jgi:hypothetical protein
LARPLAGQVRGDLKECPPGDRWDPPSLGNNPNQTWQSLPKGPRPPGGRGDKRLGSPTLRKLRSDPFGQVRGDLKQCPKPNPKGPNLSLRKALR